MKIELFDLSSFKYKSTKSSILYTDRYSASQTLLSLINSWVILFNRMSVLKEIQDAIENS